MTYCTARFFVAAAIVVTGVGVLVLGRGHLAGAHEAPDEVVEPGPEPVVIDLELPRAA